VRDGCLNTMTERDLWDAAARTRVSDRWADAASLWNTAITDALLSAAALTPDSVVLDLAAGSGDPALAIAERLIGGRVLALDSSGAGLLLANTHARRLGMGLKVKFVQADAHAIPLKRNCVDRITCRFGIMFFSDTGLVMSEVFRVLKPGGSVAFLVWGSFEQPFFDATVAVVLRLVGGAQMPTQAREMFRHASPGSLEGVLRTAGFCGIREESLTVARIWSGTPEELWMYQQEISTLCHPLFDSIPASSRPKIDAEVCALLSRFQSGSVLSVPVNVIVAAGQRP
jgi:ubiquinone/menaquinone biosynthesis C-methylase UbiE